MRPIDADALIHHFYETEYASMYYIEVVKRIIDEQPTISPDEVRGVGEWIVDSVASNVFRCSICGSDAPVCPTGGNEYKSRYCPSCGARMKGADDGTTDNT